MQYYYECLIYGLKSPVMNFFTYSSDEILNKGDLVLVSLRKKNYKAVVWRKVSKPKFKTLKIEEILLKSSLKEWQMDLVEYMSEYYFANIGTCLDLFLPSKLKDKNYDLSPLDLDLSVEIGNSELDLSDRQAKIFDKIYCNKSGISLLHGVTGSGKTEIYLQLILRLISEDTKGQVLLLVPEISLTPQMTNYLKRVFPEELLTIYNSKLNKTEKQNEWRKVFYNKSKVVIGSRSALFLPFANLKMIIVDEEHDYAYKQEQDPKYHVKSIIQWINSSLKIPVLLGSATPSVETYAAAKNSNKVAYLELPVKVKADHGLDYFVVDMKDEKRAGNYHYLSDLLLEKMRETLERGEQVLLLHNRRGSANYVQCSDCGKTEECNNCSISLTPHGKELVCHYCSFKKAYPVECNFCGSIEIKQIGLGVKKIEEELLEYFPNSRVVRVDSDTNARKEAHKENYKLIKDGHADIVVGTQTIATGLDVEKVSLVAVINVDQHLNFPDFRAHERTVQLLTQFAGRAGRGKHKGSVVLQTYQSDSEVVLDIVNEDFHSFVRKELGMRRMFEYPPFMKITKLLYSHKNKQKVQEEVRKVEMMLENSNFDRFKSSAPLIERKHNKYYHQILLFCLDPNPVIEFLDLGKGWSIDRDPMNTI